MHTNTSPGQVLVSHAREGPLPDHLMGDDGKWLQEQAAGGRRVLVRKRGDEVVGVTADGSLAGLPLPVVLAVQRVAAESCLFDGEVLGDAYHVSDVLEHDGRDCRSRPFALRYDLAMNLVDAIPSDHLRYAVTATTTTAKRDMLDRLQRNGGA